MKIGSIDAYFRNSLANIEMTDGNVLLEELFDHFIALMSGMQNENKFLNSSHS